MALNKIFRILVIIKKKSKKDKSSFLSHLFSEQNPKLSFVCCHGQYKIIIDIMDLIVLEKKECSECLEMFFSSLVSAAPRHSGLQSYFRGISDVQTRGTERSKQKQLDRPAVY